MLNKPFQLDENAPPEVQLLQLYEEYRAFCRALSFLCMVTTHRAKSPPWGNQRAAQSLALFCHTLRLRSDAIFGESQPLLERIKQELVVCYEQ